MKSAPTTTPLAEVCDFQRGLTYSKSDEVIESRNVVLRANNIDLTTGQLDLSELRYINDSVEIPIAKYVRKNTLMICTASGSKSHLGKVAYIASDYGYAFGGFMGLLSPRSGLDAKYLYYMMTSPAYVSFIQGLGVGANINNLKFDALGTFVIPTPSLVEQRRIVGILDEALEGISSAKANAEKNLQNARELFDSRTELGLSRKSAAWERKSVGELCRVRTGKKDVNQGNPDGLYPFFTCAAEHTYSDTFSFDAEALLVAGNGNVGNVLYYAGKFEAYQRTYVLSDFVGVSVKYMFRVLDKRLSRAVSKQKLGNTMPYIKLGMLTGFVVPVPPSRLAETQITESLDGVAASSERLEAIYQQKLAALDELKKSLLHRAFSGQL